MQKTNTHLTKSLPFPLQQIVQVYSRKLHSKQHYFLPFFTEWCLQQASHCYSAAGETVLAQMQFEKHVGWKGPQAFT